MLYRRINFAGIGPGRLRAYLAGLTAGRLTLWCYFVWYLVVLVRYFDPAPNIWLTALALSGIIGTALLINTTRSGSRRVKLEPWPTFRLYVCPFCVASFSALVKNRHFFLIFSPRWSEMAVAAGICLALWLSTRLARAGNPRRLADAV